MSCCVILDVVRILLPVQLSFSNVRRLMNLHSLLFLTCLLEIRMKNDCIKDIAYLPLTVRIFKSPQILNMQKAAFRERMVRLPIACCIWMLFSICFGIPTWMLLCVRKEIGTKRMCYVIWSTVLMLQKL